MMQRAAASRSPFADPVDEGMFRMPSNDEDDGGLYHVRSSAVAHTAPTATTAADDHHLDGIGAASGHHLVAVSLLVASARDASPEDDNDHDVCMRGGAAAVAMRQLSPCVDTRGADHLHIDFDEIHATTREKGRANNKNVTTVPSPSRRAKPLAPRPLRTHDFKAFAHSLPALVDRGAYRLVLTPDGGGGTYFVVPRGTCSGAADESPVAVFKPAAQEIGQPENPRDNLAQEDRFDQAFEPGKGYVRESLAFELDHGRFAGVPETYQVTLHGETGSLQHFVPRMKQAWCTAPASFDVASVHRIAVLDVRVFNCDRHGGNLLVRRDDPGFCMVPIDHGYAFPSGMAVPEFEWASWPQARLPVSADVRAYVASLDPAADAARVERALGRDAAEIVRVATHLLQVSLRHGKAYTMRDIAMYCQPTSANMPSPFERLMTSCRSDFDVGGDVDIDLVVQRLEEEFP